MNELHGTGSIKPGLGMSSLLAEIANPHEVQVDETVRQGWQATNHLIQHLDNRADGDYPNSGKPSNESQETPLNVDGYIEYLAGSDLPPDDGYLTTEQRNAFIGVREYFDQHSFEQEIIGDFATTLQRWIEASAEAKQATSVGVYITKRRLEGAELGKLLTQATPPESRQVNFPSFVDRMSRIGAAAKLFDSAVDLGKDRARRVAHPLLPFTARAGALAWSLFEGSGILATNPRLYRSLGKKALAFVRNRSGKHNKKRDHQ